jgi:hypothetical protein
MLVYHFVNANHGLDDIRRRRLKVATLRELNDPFELFGVSLKDDELRRVLQTLKEKLADALGLLCFSKTWRNPVLWSHYAASHAGLCLGFHVPDDHLHLVSYSRRRVVLETEQLKKHAIDKAALMNFLFTKYAHWRYEAEARRFIDLKDSAREGGLYFAEFGNQLRLASVMVGAQSAVTRRNLTDALGNLAPGVETRKARLAFGTFRVVRQRKEDLWT